MSGTGWLPAPVGELFGTGATAEESYEVLTVDVPPDTWISALLTARDELGCTYFDWLSAVDEPGTGFRVSAHVVALAPVRRLLVRTTVPHEAPVLPTAVDVYAGAAWHERETHEMFGVSFQDHPGLDHLLLPETFEGHPLCKDFVLAARVAKAWPGAKEPGDSEHGGPKRRQMLPPGVPDPNEWGPQKGQLPPAPSRPARGAARAAGDRPARRTRTAAEGSSGQTATTAPATEQPAAPTARPRRMRSASEGSTSQTAHRDEGAASGSAAASEGAAAPQAAEPKAAEPKAGRAAEGTPGGGEPRSAGEGAARRRVSETAERAEGTAAESGTAPEGAAADISAGAEGAPQHAGVASGERAAEDTRAGAEGAPEGAGGAVTPEQAGRTRGASRTARGDGSAEAEVSGGAEGASGRDGAAAGESAAEDTEAGAEEPTVGGRGVRSAAEGSASQRAGAAGSRRGRSASEGSASQRGEAAAPKPPTAPRSSDAPWHHARPAFDESEPEPGPSPEDDDPDATKPPTTPDDEEGGTR
ncbi:NADH-quinone oxidoreductase subunit C [Streptomyces sp. NPDC093064]|uniref:NADH-quinone oxidoreductase subunit C n=1 Tax=Streptomyces sp. NPDC093064 TaxID=3366020 RepID=UPI0037F5453A